MMFAKPLRSRVISGEITSSVRIWQTPRVRIGGRYPLGPGFVEVTRLVEIDLADVTDNLARSTGFDTAEALLAVARHGRGERVFLVEFVWRSNEEFSPSF
jgi:hypothetical protein